jgi:2-keto-4-pentenoate hydratase/2-oxohepta-3-ene-1,7-dioic acid hydratase in catechol pathway
MRFRTVRLGGKYATVGQQDGGAWALVDDRYSIDESLRRGALSAWMREGVLDLNPVAPFQDAARHTVALVRRPALLLGIGLNYREHADDLDEAPPKEPASFLKGAHTLIGINDEIVLPPGSTRVTAEAELGLVVGRTAYRVDEAEALHYLAGVCLILDQTEEDVLRRNPRFLTRAKNYPTFLSIGPELISLDEVRAVAGPLEALTVTTSRGDERRSNVVANMIFSPAYLVSFHSQVMPLRPGDVISTGTPGALVIRPGDTVTAEVSGLGTLQNRVVGDDLSSSDGSRWDD